MEPINRSTEQGAADLFAEAATRVQAGESLDTVLATYPTEYRANLRELLNIVSVAAQIHQTPAPIPSTTRRAAAKQAFLSALAAKQAEHAAIAGPRLTSARTVSPTLAERLQHWWSSVQALFSVRTMRLAPVVLALVVLWIASTSLVSLAQSAIPGDFTYPVKQWLRNQEIYLTPIERRSEVRRAQEKELVEDLKKVEEKVAEQATAETQIEKTVIAGQGLMLFHGFGENENHLKIGGLQVLTQYQPDPNIERFSRMQVVGELAPGRLVILRYQFLPGQQNAASFPVVQGISIQVLDGQPLEPTPAPTATSEPTVEPTLAPTTEPTLVIDDNCTVSAGNGWIPYNIQSGDTLGQLAENNRVSVGELRRVNCLSTEELVVGGTLLIPSNNQPPSSEESPTAEATQAVDVTPTAVISDTVTPEATATATPMDTATITATAVITLPTTPAATATAALTVTLVASSTQPAYPTVTPTISATTGVASTPTPLTTAEDGTPTPTPIPADGTTATATPGETGTAEGTPTSTTEVTPTETPTAASTTEAAPTETPTTAADADTETPTVPPTDIPAESTPTDTPTAESALTPTDTPVATPTDDPAGTAEASDAPTPTEAPPTDTPIPTEPPPTDTPVPTEPPPTATPIPTEPPPTATEAPPTEPPPPAEPPAAEPTATFTPSA